MINEQQQEQASLYVLGGLTDSEASAFETELRANASLREVVRGLQRTAGLLAQALPAVPPPRELRDKVLKRIGGSMAPFATADNPAIAPAAALRFVDAGDEEGWKRLPVPGAWIKLLSLEKARGYAVLLGKLEPGARYPAHVNVGPEDLCILTGDLHVGNRRLNAGDFHHADAGSYHDVNYSIEGCTLMAVLPDDHPLVAVAMS